MSRLASLAVLVFTALPCAVVLAQDGPEAVPGEAQESIPAAVPEQMKTEAEDASDEAISARARYNLALEKLDAGEPAAAAEGFLAARDQAGPDPELRYRAAFNLGLALAAQADEIQAGEPEQAIELLRGSAAWFNDAIRLAGEGDEDARVNLEIVLRRIQQLADQLNQGKRLETRLERVIDDQRGLRDDIRRLLAAIGSEGAGAEPLGFQREFEELATRERVLLAEVGNINDLAAEERTLIEEKAEQERSQQEAMRAVQLQGLGHYAQQARQSLSDTRRRLRQLEAERAHRRADAALEELKRAREQLSDPVAILKGIAADEASLLDHTQTLALLDSGVLRLEGQEQPAAPPGWLNNEHLGQRQEYLVSRGGEILARLEAGSRQEASAERADPGQQRMLQAAAEAVPLLENAVSAMRDAQTALAGDALPAAVGSELQALRALAGAIERFADVRGLIELAHADQAGVVQLLTPGDQSPLAGLSTEQRGQAIGQAVGANRERLGRLQGMLADELAQAEAQALQQQAQQPGAQQEDRSAVDALRHKYGLAEQLRARAGEALEALADGLAGLGTTAAAPDLLPPASEGLRHIEELRRLFFDLLQHLQDLLGEQAETYDRTATLGFEAVIDALVTELGLVLERQGGHAVKGDALAQALAQQADAAGAAEQEQAPRLAEAAGEVRKAAGRMQSAGALLADAGQRAGAMSPNLEPVLDEQLAAMEHLENAIRLLQPPQQDPQNQQEQQNQQQQQQQQARDQDEEMTQRQALRRLQAIRDREAERQRRREQQQAQTEPVEKDW